MNKTILILLIFASSLTVFGQTSATKEAQADKRGYIVKVGDQSPTYKMTLDDGQEVSLDEHKGKVVMLQFTASWCGVCRKEMPLIEAEIWQKLKDNPDFVLIGVDRDEPLDKVLTFKEQTKVTYPLALDPGADVFAMFASKKSGVTRNVIIDKNGEIVFLTRLFDREEFDEMKEVIFELLEVEHSTEAIKSPSSNEK